MPLPQKLSSVNAILGLCPGRFTAAISSAPSFNYDILCGTFYFAAANKQAASGDTTSMLNSLEYVAVTITLTHVRRGALKILLSSPNGTNCTLSTPRPADL